MGCLFAARLAERSVRVTVIDIDRERLSVIRRDGIRYFNKLEVPAGTYGVWFVVRDNVTGRTGSVVSTVAAK